MAYAKSRLSLTMRTKLITLFVAVLISGCAIHFGGGYKADSVSPKDKKLSIVFGYIDMKDAPSELSWVHIWRYEPNHDVLYGGMTQDGLFWHMGMGRGEHQLAAFGSKVGHFTNVQNDFHLGWKKNNETSVNIRKPGVYYMGSYRYVHVPSGSITKVDGFRLTPNKSVSERKLLNQLLTILQNDYGEYTHQIELVKKQLAQLGAE